jgi:hypothetical protein
MNPEAGYNYLDTSFTGTSAAYLSGVGSDLYNIHKIISPADIGSAMSTSQGEAKQII